MKKKLTLMLVALLGVAAFATTWKVTADTPVAAGTTLIDDDVMTVKTVFATTLKADAQTIGGSEFDSYIQVRVKADPTTAVPEGTDNGGSTSLVITPKQNAVVKIYYRRQSTAQTDNKGAYESNDGKDLKVYDQSTAKAIEGALTIDRETDDGKYGWAVKEYSLEKGKVYTASARGTTIQLYGIDYDAVVDQLLFNQLDPSSVKYSDRTKNDGEISEELTLEDLQGVKLTVTPSTSSTANCYYLDNAYGIQLRVFGGAKLKFEAPEGKMIQKISFLAGIWTVQNSGTPGKLDQTSWTGESRKVTVSIGAKSFINGIKVTLIDKKDFSVKVDEALAAVEDGETATLTMYDDYVMDKAVVVPAGKQLVIDGDGNTLTAGAETGIVTAGDLTLKNVTVDATALTQPLVSLNGSAVQAKNADGTDNANYKAIGSIRIEDAEVKGLAQAVVKDVQKTLVGQITIENSVVELIGGNNVFDFSGKGYAASIAVNKSTLWSKEGHTGYFIQTSGRVRDLDGNQATYKETTSITKSTLYQIAVNKQMNNLQGKGQKSLAFEIKESILYNTGSSAGNEVRGWLGGQNSTNPSVAYASNTYWSEGAIAAGWTDKSKQGADASATQLVTDPTFKDAENGDFTVHAGSLQAKQKTGDPRWLVSYDKEQAMPLDVEADVATGAELSAAVELAKATVDKAAVVTLNLAKDGQYTITSTITTDAGIVINGNGAKVDASELEGDFITLDGTKAVAKKADGTDSDHKLIENVTISGVTITGLKGAVVTDAQKTLVEKLTIDNSVIEVPAAGKNVLNFNGKGYVGEVVVKNSTIWANGKNTGFFAQYGSRPKNVNGDWLQQFDVQNSTFVNIANGKNFCNFNQKGTAQNVYTIKNNIFVDCGKANQVIVGFNAGQTSAAPVWDVDGNVFNVSGADGSAAEVSKAGQQNGEDIVKNSVAGVVEFTDAAEGNFNGVITLAEGAETPATVPGDNTNFNVTIAEATGIEAVKATDAADLDGAVIYNLNGQRVDKAQKGLYIINGRKVVIK